MSQTRIWAQIKFEIDFEDNRSPKNGCEIHYHKNAEFIFSQGEVSGIKCADGISLLNCVVLPLA